MQSGSPDDHDVTEAGNAAGVGLAASRVLRRLVAILNKTRAIDVVGQVP